MSLHSSAAVMLRLFHYLVLIPSCIWFLCLLLFPHWSLHPLSFAITPQRRIGGSDVADLLFIVALIVCVGSVFGPGWFCYSVLGVLLVLQ